MAPSGSVGGRGRDSAWQSQPRATVLLVICFHIFFPVPLALKTKHWDTVSGAFMIFPGGHLVHGTLRETQAAV